MEEPSNGKIETLEEEEEEEEEEQVVEEVEQLKIQEENPEEKVHDGKGLIPENSISIEEKVEEEKKGAIEPSLESSSEAGEVVRMQNWEEVEEKRVGAAEDGKTSSLEVKDGVAEEGVVVGGEKDGGEVVEKSVEEVVQQSTNVDVAGIGSNDANPENAGTTPIVSLIQHAGQPTSWRSCCGLLDVLGRSNR